MAKLVLKLMFQGVTEFADHNVEHKSAYVQISEAGIRDLFALLFLNDWFV